MLAWRIRNLSAWNKNGGDKSNWDSVYLYAQRSIIPLKSTLVMGKVLHFPVYLIVYLLQVFS